MTMLTMRHDFRAPAFGPATTREIYAAALEQYRWADAQGWDMAVLSEHHGIDDGWLPAPLTMAGIILGSTPRIPVFVSASILPLHDPVRIEIPKGGYQPTFVFHEQNPKRSPALLALALTIVLCLALFALWGFRVGAHAGPVSI